MPHYISGCAATKMLVELGPPHRAIPCEGDLAVLAATVTEHGDADDTRRVPTKLSREAYDANPAFRAKVATVSRELTLVGVARGFHGRAFIDCGFSRQLLREAFG
jgi:hypothetical protein